MTDFFDRLAERTLGAAPLAQPLIPAAFSPAPGWVEAYSEVETWSEPATPEGLPLSPSALPVPDNAPPTTLVAPVQPASVITVEPTSSVQEPEGRERRVQPSIEDQSAAEQASELDRQGTPPDVPAGGSPTSRDTIPRPERHLESQVILVPVTGQLEPSRPAPLEAGQVEAEFASPRQAMPDTTAQSQSHPARPATLPAQSRLSPAHPIQTPSEAPADLSGSVPHTEPEASESPEPVIRISIGRVEVRLVQAPPPSPVKQSSMRSSPALSLDEYLKRRQDGKR